MDPDLLSNLRPSTHQLCHECNIISVSPFKKEVKEIGELVSQIYGFSLYVSKWSGGVEPSYFSIRSGKERLIGSVLAMGAIN